MSRSTSPRIPAVVDETLTQLIRLRRVVVGDHALGNQRTAWLSFIMADSVRWRISVQLTLVYRGEDMKRRDAYSDSSSTGGNLKIALLVMCGSPSEILN